MEHLWRLTMGIECRMQMNAPQRPKTHIIATERWAILFGQICLGKARRGFLNSWLYKVKLSRNQTISMWFIALCYIMLYHVICTMLYHVIYIMLYIYRFLTGVLSVKVMWCAATILFSKSCSKWMSGTMELNREHYTSAIINHHQPSFIQVLNSFERLWIAGPLASFGLALHLFHIQQLRCHWNH